MRVNKVLELDQTIETIQVTLLQNRQIINRTMLIKRHQAITLLFNLSFGVRIDEIKEWQCHSWFYCLSSVWNNITFLGSNITDYRNKLFYLLFMSSELSILTLLRKESK